MPYIDSQGNLFNAVPDIAMLGAGLNTGVGQMTLDLSYANQGDNTLNAPYQITVFANALGGEVLETVSVSSPLPVGATAHQSIALPMATLCEMEGLSKVVAAVNCDGGGIAQEGGQQPECDLTNNTGEVPVDLQSEPTHLEETSCDAFEWYGQTLTQSGEYELTLPNMYGCDSTLVLTLTVNHSDTVHYDITSCESYEWHGTTYTESGEYTYSTTNASGCDRLEVLSLEISDSYVEVVEATGCDSYYWAATGQWYYESALDSLTVEGASGSCDSLFVLSLELGHADTLELGTVTACDTYEWHGTTYTESGLLTYLTTNETGCDRLERLELVVNHGSEHEMEVMSCEPYWWCGELLTESGTYSHLLEDAHGCDSLLTLHLELGEEYVQEESAESCSPYWWHGELLTETGQYELVSENPEGCDSLFVLHLTMGQPYESELVETTCTTYWWDGVPYTETGEYTRTYYSQMGCDSLVTLHLTVLDTYESELDTTVCERVTWEGVEYEESGTYERVYQTEEGCDSTLVLHLTVRERPTATITGKTEVFVATDLVAGTYTYHIDPTEVDPSQVEWRVDPPEWVLYPHGASCDLVCTTAETGVLYATTDEEDCGLETSLTINGAFYGVGEPAADAVEVYPNPVKGKVRVSGSELRGVRVLDVMGQELLNVDCEKNDRCVIDMEGYRNGLYLLEVTTTAGRTTRTLVLTK